MIYKYIDEKLEIYIFDKIINLNKKKNICKFCQFKDIASQTCVNLPTSIKILFYKYGKTCSIYEFGFENMLYNPIHTRVISNVSRLKTNANNDIKSMIEYRN